MILVQYIYVCDGPDHHVEVGHDVAEVRVTSPYEKPPDPGLPAGWDLTDDGHMLCPICAKGRESDARSSSPH